MQNLTRASEELFRRGPDECFAIFDDLGQHCQNAKVRSVERWHPATELRVEFYAGTFNRSRLRDDLRPERFEVHAGLLLSCVRCIG